MKKRVFSIILVFTLLICAAPFNALAATNVTANLANFKVTLNGVLIDSENAKYPLIVYKDITYFPMTYWDCRFMAVTTDWNNDTRTLKIDASGVSEEYHPTTQDSKNPNSLTASIVEYNVVINGTAIDNKEEPYPLLNFRDVTYFPMTWRFCVTEFGWQYSFAQDTGLVVTSSTGNSDTNSDNTQKANSTEEIKVSSISLDKSSIELASSESTKLSATVYPENATDKSIAWSSSDSSVATVENGVVIGQKAGSAIISAKTSNGLVAVCNINVTVKSQVANNPNYEKQKEALDKMKRYRDYLNIDREILATQIELYNNAPSKTGKAAQIIEIQEQIITMQKELQDMEKIMNDYSEYLDYDPLQSAFADIDYPLYLGSDRSFLTAVKSFSRDVQWVVLGYDGACDLYLK